MGVEGRGFIWRPDADSDDEKEEVQDFWGEKWRPGLCLVQHCRKDANGINNN